MRAQRTPIAVLRAAGLALVASLCLASVAQAAQTVKLQASFTPDRYGASTTINFGFTISSSEGGLPSPLTHIDLRMPPGMNYITSSLGLATCQPAKLVELGLAGCPANSRLGKGSAFVEVPFGANAGHEIPEIAALMGPPHKGNVVVLFYANGLAPVYAQIVFQGELVSGGGSFGEDLAAAIPLIPSVTNGPPVSIINVKSTIGPSGLTYYKRVHGRLVGYKPQGVSVPERCPHGGYPFAAGFAFLDGSTATATTHVPCPPSRRRHK
ncbi:MAG TPA: hypothetical protein VHU13_00625 [Solirubrobacteraceae bacterium]|jgi:hypothetical protein|nr:hypothetical protein [Solirubrobacteraceae bacterium]